MAQGSEPHLDTAWGQVPTLGAMSPMVLARLLFWGHGRVPHPNSVSRNPCRARALPGVRLIILNSLSTYTCIPRIYIYIPTTSHLPQIHMRWRSEQRDVLQMFNSNNVFL